MAIGLSETFGETLSDSWAPDPDPNLTVNHKCLHHRHSNVNILAASLNHGNHQNHQTALHAHSTSFHSLNPQSLEHLSSSRTISKTTKQTSFVQLKVSKSFCSSAYKPLNWLTFGKYFNCLKDRQQELYQKVFDHANQQAVMQLKKLKMASGAVKALRKAEVGDMMSGTHAGLKQTCEGDMLSNLCAAFEFELFI
jgi:hypothetical protein